MTQVTLMHSSFEDALMVMDTLSFYSSFDYNPSAYSKARVFEGQIRTVARSTTTTFLHALVQMEQGDRLKVAKALCGGDPQKASAQGHESVFFSLMTEPAAAKVLLAFAPIERWLGYNGYNPENRTIGVAVIDLSRINQTPPVFGSGITLNPYGLQRVVQGGDRFNALAKGVKSSGPAVVYQFLIGLHTGDIRDMGTPEVKVVPYSSMNDLASPTEGDQRVTVQQNADDSKYDVSGGTESGEVSLRPPSQWSPGTWALAFTACAAMIGAGILFIPLLAGAGTLTTLFAANAAAFAMDAAIMKFAEGVLAVPSATFTPKEVQVELTIFLIGVIQKDGTVTLLIDGAPDATPKQPY